MTTPEIPILFEDSDVLAIDKPTGMMVHADGRSAEPTVVDWILENRPEIAEREVGETQTLQSGEEIVRPGIVHRLDAETSGVLLIAKTKDMHAHLKAQFQSHSIEKEYRAVVAGIVKEDETTIDRPIGRSAGDFRKWSAQRGAKGKLREAETRIEVIERFENVTHIKAFPTTGRTHQIRVHLKAIHHPVLCDALYGFKDTPCPPEIGRLALHAYRISFTDLGGDKREIISAVPDSIKEMLNVS